MINIRLATKADLTSITAIYNEAVRNTTATFDTEERTEADQESWLASHDIRHPIIVAEVVGNIVGWASLSRWSDRCAYADTAEVSLYVDVDWRGQGVGRALMHDIITRGRQCGLHSVLSRIVAGNAVSIHLHQAAGFETVGIMREVGNKFGRRLDVILMQLIYQ